MEVELVCPKCAFIFTEQEWYDGECPNCDNSYWWEEEVSEDGSDYWGVVYWEEY